MELETINKLYLELSQFATATTQKERDAGAAYRRRIKELADKCLRLEHEIAELRQWKTEAMAVMPDFQAIGAELGLTAGDSVHDKILTGIQHLKRVIFEMAPEQSPFQADARRKALGVRWWKVTREIASEKFPGCYSSVHYMDRSVDAQGVLNWAIKHFSPDTILAVTPIR